MAKKSPHTVWLKVFFIVFPLIWLINLLLPFLVRPLVNRALSKLGAYSGNLRRLRIRLFQPAFIIHDFHMEEIREKRTRFVSCREFRMDFEWLALWKRTFVCDVRLKDCSVYLEKGEEDAEKTTTVKDKAPQNEIVLEMPTLVFPAIVKSFEVLGGRLDFEDTAAQPQVKLEVSEIEMRGTNISTVPLRRLPPAEIRIRATAYSGTIDIQLKATLYEKRPAFDMNLEVKNIDMPRLNPMFEAYGKFDVSDGRMGLFAEVAAKGGRFRGYVKPLIRDLKVLGRDDRSESALNRIWQGMIGTVKELFENQKKDQLATKIPMQGTFNEPNIRIWRAVMYVLRNAFVAALKPSIDHEIDLGSARNQRL
ncbi:MAG: DUF748 domain-containing protein [Bacteroidota bacterium]